MSRVRIVDVAREAGVSLGTVSNALNHPERVRPDTRKLIEETIDRLGYLPNQSARLLAGGTNKVLGLVLPCLTHGCNVQIVNGARNEALRHGYDLIVLCANEDAEYEARYLRFLAGMQVAGALVQPIGDVERYEALGLPVHMVYLGVRDVPNDALSVTPDFEAQGSVVAEHVLSRGAQHVAVIGEPDVPMRAQRLEGVRSALAVYEPERVELILEGRSHGSIDGVRLGSMFARRDPAERPDAIIALSDVLATGAIAGVQAAGRSVPDDIMVAGCDGNPLAWTGAVQLTTCSPAGYELGRKGVQLLIRTIEEAEEEQAVVHVRVQGASAMQEGRRGRPAAHEVIRPFLLERTSTGAAPLTGEDFEGFPTGIPEYDIGSFL